MNFNTLTTTLSNFTTAFAGAYDRLMPIRNYVLGTLLVIEVVLIGLYWALGQGDRIANVIKKILFLGIWIWISTSFSTLAKAFVESLIQAGLTAGGRPGSAQLLLDPSRIGGMGLDLLDPLAASLENVGTFDLADMFIYGLSYYVLMGAFFLMAFQVFLAVLEYYLLLTVASVLVPFGILQPTKFLAEKAIASVVSAGIKLMVLAFILGIAEPALRSIRFSGTEIQLNELMSVMFTTCAIALLTWKGPGLAAGLLAGSPSLGAGDVAGAGVAGAMLAGHMISGGAAVAKAAANGVGGAFQATKSAAGALGRAFGGGGGGGGGASADAAAAAAGAVATAAPAAATSVGNFAAAQTSGGSAAQSAGPTTASVPSSGAGWRPPAATGAGASTLGTAATLADPAAPTMVDAAPPWASQAFTALRGGASYAADAPSGPAPPATPRR